MSAQVHSTFAGNGRRVAGTPRLRGRISSFKLRPMIPQLDNYGIGWSMVCLCARHGDMRSVEWMLYLLMKESKYSVPKANEWLMTHKVKPNPLSLYHLIPQSQPESWHVCESYSGRQRCNLRRRMVSLRSPNLMVVTNVICGSRRIPSKTHIIQNTCYGKVLFNSWNLTPETPLNHVQKQLKCGPHTTLSEK